MTTAAAMTAVNPYTHVNPMASGAATDPDSTTAATISANDFLTLLVTEMKNQDPTAQTDPNAYVNQLVQVNSLEQLIEIKENLMSALGTAANAAGVRTTVGHPQAVLGSSPNTSGAGMHTGTTGIGNPVQASAKPVAAFAGNLGVSETIPASQRMAQALSGRK